MSESPSVFLETTIMADLLCKAEKSKRKIGEVLSNYGKTYTSNYARMEFKKGLLQNLIYLHGKVTQSNSLTDVSEAISRLSATPQRHLLQSILEQTDLFYRQIYQKRVSTIMKEYGDVSIDEYLKQNVESFLSNLIRQSWRRFAKMVDEMINPTSCFIDIEGPRRAGRLYDNTPRTCDKSKSRCQIREFFRDNSNSFVKIFEGLKALHHPDPETTNRIRSLKKILRLLMRNRDIMIKDCWNCGDAILAIEAPHDADIFNNNQKHYIPICKAIDKKSVGYV